MTKQIAMILAAVLLVTGLAYAQGNGMGMASGPRAQMGLMAQGQPQPLTSAERIAKRVEMLTKVLDLTTTQAASITTILTKEAADMKPLQAELATLRGQLKTAVDAGNLGGIDTAAATIGTVHGKVVALQAKTHVAFFAVLTPDQISKLQAIRKHFGDRP